MGAVLKIGDRVRTVIGDVAFGGDGVGRVDDLVLFVPFTVDGDEAEVEITEVKKRYARGSLVRIIAPSATGWRRSARITPAAAAAGCSISPMPINWSSSDGRSSETFRRIAKLSPPPLAPVIPSPRPYRLSGKGGVPSRRRAGRAATDGADGPGEPTISSRSNGAGSSMSRSTGNTGASGRPSGAGALSAPGRPADHLVRRAGRTPDGDFYRVREGAGCHPHRPGKAADGSRTGDSFRRISPWSGNWSSRSSGCAGSPAGRR